MLGAVSTVNLKKKKERNWDAYNNLHTCPTVKILKFGTPQTIFIIVLEIEKFEVTLH